MELDKRFKIQPTTNKPNKMVGKNQHKKTRKTKNMQTLQPTSKPMNTPPNLSKTTAPNEETDE